MPWFSCSQDLGGVHTHPLPPGKEELDGQQELCPQHPPFDLLENLLEEKTGRRIFVFCAG